MHIIGIDHVYEKLIQINNKIEIILIILKPKELSNVERGTILLYRVVQLFFNTVPKLSVNGLIVVYTKNNQMY